MLGLLGGAATGGGSYGGSDSGSATSSVTQNFGGIGGSPIPNKQSPALLLAVGGGAALLIGVLLFAVLKARK